MNKENDFCKLWDDVYVTNFHAVRTTTLFSTQLYIVITINPPPLLSYINV